ncbi:MFS transporter, partial [Mitsuokella multacida]
MTKEKLWSRDFLALTTANGLLFVGFHILLPTLPIYMASLGASGSEIGLIAGIFGYSAIFIRLFTDTGVRAFGKKTCLYAGLLLSLLATAGYALLDSIGAIVVARVIHGFGFGLSTTFAAALVADVIPASRRGEGIGYFGLGSTIAMALAPAFGLMLLSDISPWALF